MNGKRAVCAHIVEYKTHSTKSTKKHSQIYASDLHKV